MRIIICGGRDYEDLETVQQVMSALWGEATLVHGDARGVDTMASRFWTGVLGHASEAHPADWRKHGKAAGPIRNQEMLDAGAHLVIAFPGGRGTADMVGRARSAGVPVLHVDGGGA